MLKRAYIEITNMCNLRCSFCPGTGRKKEFMTPERFRLLAEKLRGHVGYLYLHVMGEPLLHPRLGEILSIAADLGFRLCLTTNGTLLGERGGTVLRKRPNRTSPPFPIALALRAEPPISGREATADGAPGND